MSFIKLEPEKTREEILEAEAPEEILEEGYSESDLRRDWYLVNLERQPPHELFSEKGIPGIEVVRDGRKYRIAGFPHVTRGGELKERVENYVRSLPDDCTMFYEQGLDNLFDIGGAGIEIDDQGWALEEAESRGIDYTERKAEMNGRMFRKQHGVKNLSKMAGYLLVDKLGHEELAGNFELLRDGEHLINMVSTLENPSKRQLREFQEDTYRTRLPEPLSGELLEDDFRDILTSGRSERMADFVRSRTEEGKVSVLTGAGHMFQIPYYLENNSPGDIEVSDIDIDRWFEEEYRPKVEEKI